MLLYSVRKSNERFVQSEQMEDAIEWVREYVKRWHHAYSVEDHDMYMHQHKGDNCHWSRNYPDMLAFRSVTLLIVVLREFVKCLVISITLQLVFDAVRTKSNGRAESETGKRFDADAERE